MTRLPIPGGDDNTWGNILNGFLDVSHNEDGTLQPSALVQAGAVTSVNSKTPSNGSVSLAASDVGAVPSVFGRTGAVVAASGDYTASQVLNAADTSSTSLQAFAGTISAPALDAAGLTGVTAASRYVGATTSGAPSSGTFAVGDLCVDQTGTIWICTTAGTPGVWCSTLGRHVFNVINFGADPTNTSDSYPAIQAAINAASTGTGGIVYFPPGNYGISQPLEIDYSGVMLQGAGYGFTSAIICNFTSAQTAMVICSVTAVRSYINIDRLCIQGNKNPFSGYGILYCVEVGKISNCVVQFTASDGIAMRATMIPGSTTDTNTLEDIYVEFAGGYGVFNNISGDNEWSRVHVSGGAMNTAPPYSSTVVYSTFSHVSYNGFLYTCAVEGTTNIAPNGTASSNANWTYVTSLVGGLATLWNSSTNYAASTPGKPVLVFYGSSGYLYACAAANTNTPPSGTTSSTSEWVYMSGLDGFHVGSDAVKLSVCHPFDCVQYGLNIVANAGNGCQVIGGEYESNNLAGIFVDSVKNITISGPTFYDDPNPTIPAEHILINTGANNVTISGCTFHQSKYSIPNAIQIGSGGATNVTISNCVADDVASGTATGMTNFLNVNGTPVSNLIVTGNQLSINSSLTAGIYLEGATNCDVSGNRMGGASIVEGSGANYNTFDRNDLTGGGTITLTGANSYTGYNPGFSTINPAWVPADNGLLAANGDWMMARDGQTPTAGTLYLNKVQIRHDMTWTNVWFAVSTAGAGASTGSYVGLYNSSGTLLSGSADIGSDLTVNGTYHIALTTPQVLAAGTFVWVAFLCNLATTQPTLSGWASTQATANVNLSAANLRCAVNGTGLTSLPATIAPSSNSGNNSARFAVAAT